MILLAKEEHWK